MPLDLADYERKAREAVKAFWGNRAAAVQKQRELGHSDQGERAGVTAGKNMDGFIALIQDVALQLLYIGGDVMRPDRRRRQASVVAPREKPVARASVRPAR